MMQGKVRARSLRAVVSVSTLALAMALSTPALAQSDTSTLEGHVDGATPGSQVVAVDRNTGQRVTGTIDANGDYRVLGIRPSTYDVSVEGKPTQTTTVLVGQTTTVNFINAAEEVTQTGDVIVRGRRSITEVRTQSVSTNITPAQIANLPQNQRNFLSFAELAPGVAVTRGGNAQLQAGGTSSSNTNVLLDGLTLKNPINHGGVFGQNFGLGNPFPQSAIQEYKIDTQNFGAETGQVGSALITAVTKTGGRDFHGSAFLQWQPRSFTEQPYFDKKADRPKPEYDRKQFGGELGGPIVPGVLSFYVAGEGTISQLPGSFGKLDTGVTLPANIQNQILTSRNKDFKQGLYFGKLTWFAGGNDTVNLEAFIRRENNLSDIDDNAAATHGRTILTHQDRYQLQWKHSAGDFLNVLNLAYDKGEQSTPSVGTGPEYLLSRGTSFDTVAQLGTNSFEQGDNSKSYTVRDDASFVRGDHTLKAGFQVALLDLARTVNDHFNGTYFFTNPGAGGTLDPATSIPYGARINTQPTPTVAFKDTQLGFYVQDEWKPDEHWTINLGIRYDLETNANNNTYVTPQRIVDALRSYQGWQAAGIDPDDYISTGNNRKPQYDAIQPRLGVAYDVFGDRDLVLFAGAGRYFDRSLFIEGVIETLNNSNNVATVNFCSAAVTTNCTQFTDALRDPDTLRASVAAAGTGGSVWLLNNETKLPFSDQFDVGVRKKFGQIQTSLTLSHIRSHNIFQYVRGNRYENGWYTRFVDRDANGNVTGCRDGGNAWIQDAIPGSLTNADGSAVPTNICAAQNGNLPGFNGKLNIGANRGKAYYTALYLSADKPFTDTSTWGFTTALTIQLARTNDAQELNSDEFYNGTAQDVYGNGWVRGVEKYRLVATGNYRAPFDIQLSGTLNLSSGPSFGSVRFLPNTPDGACCYGFLGGKYYPTNFIAYKRLDLRVAKTFKMPYDRDHELTVDFQAFNVFNWLNRDYSSWGAGAGTNPTFVEDSQIGNDARSFQAGVKYTF
jgi:hypothetical protein